MYSNSSSWPWPSGVCYGDDGALLAEMRKELNEQLSSAARLTRILERREPFVKTATHKIKRYLYSGGSMMS